MLIINHQKVQVFVKYNKGKKKKYLKFQIVIFPGPEVTRVGISGIVSLEHKNEISVLLL